VAWEDRSEHRRRSKQHDAALLRRRRANSNALDQHDTGVAARDSNVVSTARVAADGTSGDIFSPFHSMQKASPFYLTCSEDFVIHTDAENASFCKCLPNFAHLCNIKTALVQLALVRGTRRWSQTCGCCWTMWYTGAGSNTGSEAKEYYCVVSSRRTPLLPEHCWGRAHFHEVSPPRFLRLACRGKHRTLRPAARRHGEGVRILSWAIHCVRDINGQEARA
jgi:hypothetical protein